MTSITLFPPAKVNLYLAVGARQPDGYHRLDTLFERLDLCDELQLTRQAAPGITLRCSDPALPTDGRNLVVRAAAAFLQAAGITAGVAIELVKKIPVAGGLGGGSSDAAATLRGLNTLYDQPLSDEALTAIGRRLGADVPLFLQPAVIARGRRYGDEITPAVAPPVPFWHVLVNPGVMLLTRAVYETFDRLPAGPSSLTRSDDDVRLLLRFVQAGDVAAVAAHLANALEPAIEASYPAIRAVQEALRECGVLGLLVSGSGPTTYGVAADESQARAIAQRVRRAQPTWTTVVARTALAPAQTHPAAPVRGDAHHARLPH